VPCFIIVLWLQTMLQRPYVLVALSKAFHLLGLLLAGSRFESYKKRREHKPGANTSRSTGQHMAGQNGLA
jgi:hypothetical protein